MHLSLWPSRGFDIAFRYASPFYAPLLCIGTKLSRVGAAHDFRGRRGILGLVDARGQTADPSLRKPVRSANTALRSG